MARDSSPVGGGAGEDVMAVPYVLEMKKRKDSWPEWGQHQALSRLILGLPRR
jgi:hypothetical protein